MFYAHVSGGEKEMTPASGWICLRPLSREGNHLLASYDLRTDKEIDCFVDEIIKSAKRAGKNLKKKLKKANGKYSL